MGRTRQFGLCSLLQLGNAMTAMRRLSQFLIMEERADEVEKLPSPGAIITDGNFYWAEAAKPKVSPLMAVALTPSAQLYCGAALP